MAPSRKCQNFHLPKALRKIIILKWRLKFASGRKVAFKSKNWQSVKLAIVIQPVA